MRFASVLGAIILLECLGRGSPAIACEPGWTMIMNKCYKFVQNTWQSIDSARGICKNFGATLPSIHSADENKQFFAFASKYANGTAQQVALGLRRDNITRTWRWDDGSPFNYSNWISGYPSNLSDSNCATIVTLPQAVTYLSYWADTGCEYNLHNYTCVKAPPACEIGWTLINNKCYKYFNGHYTIDNATSICKSLGANLPSFHSYEEQSQFIAFMNKYSPGPQGSVWIGLIRDPVTKMWSWRDGSAFDFVYWDAGRPAALDDPLANCAYLNTLQVIEQMWNSGRCEPIWSDFANDFVCAKAPLGH